jgi:hypothetical protein
MNKGQNKYKDVSVLVIITCNREEMLKTLVNSIDPDCLAKKIIVNNGAPLKGTYDGYEIIQSKRNPTPVGSGKNIAIREALKFNPNCFLYLLEEDVEILDNGVWEKYGDTMLDSGILGQLSFATHGSFGSGNLNPDGSKRVLSTVAYTKTQVDFYEQSYAAFTLYHGSIFPKVGYMDENFVNAAEHLDHYQRIANGKNGMIGCPFFYFPDILDSFEYIKDQDQNFENSAIRSQPNFKQNFVNAWEYFRKKHGKVPNELPRLKPDALMKVLTEIEARYSQKDLL